MEKAEKKVYLEMINAGEVDRAIEGLLAVLPTGHPAVSRISQLKRRQRELGERIQLGTLNNDDVTRVRARITGGLKDLVQELKPMPDPSGANPKPAKQAFKLELDTPAPAAPVPAEVPELGFWGEVVYEGSPTKKEQVVVLRKGYGASYHTAREAIKKAGMEMVSGDRSGGKLEAKIAPTGAGGYGEKILLWLTPVDAASTRVHVVVDSQLPTQAFDFGRNKTKLGILVSYLR